MNCKPIRLLYATVLILSAVFYVPGSAQAKRENHGILIIYTTIDGKKSSHVKMLDLLAGHFTSHVTVKKDADVTSSDLEGKERVIYFGQTKRKLSKELVSLISGFQKQVVAIGFNAGQIANFPAYR